MGSNHSVNRKEILEDYGVVNHSNKEKLMNQANALNNNNNTVPGLMESMVKENIVPSNHDMQLATAYLHKYANVSKRRMKTIFKPSAPMNTNSTIVENKVSKLPQTNATAISAIRPPATNTAQTPKNLSKYKLTLTSSHFGMKCLGTFVCARYLRILPHLSVNEVIMWIKNVDRALTLSGWQDRTFLTIPNITFVYLVARDALPETVHSMSQLKAELLTVLYMAYTYGGPEISYPLKPFLTEKNRALFWKRCVAITNNQSAEMLKLNKDAQFYEEIQTELASYGCLFQRSAKRG